MAASEEPGKTGREDLEVRVARLEREVEELRRGGRQAPDTGVVPERPIEDPPIKASVVRERLRSRGARREGRERPARRPVGEGQWERQGERWLGRIGVAFVLLALGFLFKYSFDQGWITPAFRIVLGLMLGGFMLGAGLRLQPTRKGFSQILLGGGLAVLYLDGFAAFQLYELVSYPVAFAFLVAVSAAGFWLSLRQDRSSLSTIAVAGALSTPFLVASESGTVPGLVGYAVLVIVTTSAIQARRGWRAPLAVLATGGTAVLAFAMDRAADDERLWVSIGLLAQWAACAAMPLVTPHLSRLAPDRWRAPTIPIPDPNESTVRVWQGVDGLLTRAIPLFVGLPLWGMAIGMWDLERVGGGIAGVALGLAFAGVAWLTRGTARARWAGAELAAVFIVIGTAVAWEQDGTVLVVAIEAAAMVLLARAWSLPSLRIVSDITFSVLSLVFLGRSAGMLGEMTSGSQATIGLTGFDWLGGILVAGVVARLHGEGTRRRIYQVVVYLALLLWFLVELGQLSNGQALVSIAWGACGIILLVASMRTGGSRLQIGGLATLGLVAGKLLLVDMAQLDMIWRILLFMGFGAAFLMLSYFIRRAPPAADPAAATKEDP